MTDLTRINLLRLFDLYLVLVLIIGIIVRYRKYRAVILLIRTVPDRWPTLFKIIKEERALFLNWGVLLPVLGTAALLLLHTGAYRFIWATADVSLFDLSRHWPWLAWVCLSGLLMIATDFYMIFSGTNFDSEGVEKQLEQAEYWLSSWVSSAVSVVTLGFIKPRKIVRKELRKSLGQAVKALDNMIYYWLVQIAVRFVFGISLWIAWLSLVKLAK